LPGILPTDSTAPQNLDTARSSQAVQTLRGAQSAGTDHNKIDKAARNFESLLVGHWLEQAEKSFASVPGTDPDEQQDSSRDQFMSIACESLAQGLSRNGGFGIAHMISKQLEAVAVNTAPSTKNGDEPSNDKPLHVR
jgi:Rod binding domain-containing protein